MGSTRAARRPGTRIRRPQAFPFTIPTVHCVYIVRCADGSFYTGYARDVQARVKAHNAGRGAKYTSVRRPVRLVYAEVCESLGSALRREHAIKRLTRAGKKALFRRLNPAPES